jgi:hypothetical protein
MLTVIAAAALAFGSPSPETLSAERLIARSISEALAFQRACPVVVLDQGFVATVLAKAGVRIAPLMPDIDRQRPYHQLSIAPLETITACRLARRLFGPDGTRAAGFLSDRER